METLAELHEEIEHLAGCCLHTPLWIMAEVEEVVAWYRDSPEGYGSEEQKVLVKLKSGGYGLLISSADTTGHGCQCDSFTARSDTLLGVLSHLHEDEILLLLDPHRGTLAGEV